jgi:hypothetical protein
VLVKLILAYHVADFEEGNLKRAEVDMHVHSEGAAHAWVMWNDKLRQVAQRERDVRRLIAEREGDATRVGANRGPRSPGCAAARGAERDLRDDAEGEPSEGLGA